MRNLAWLLPDAICSKSAACTTQLKRALVVLVNSGHVQEGSCDDILCEYERFVKKAAISDSFLNFSLEKDRLDTLFYDSLVKKDEYWHLWGIVRVVLLLSHGQATVERGFSTNKETMVDNMAEHTLIGKRVVKDFLSSTGCKVADVNVTPQLLAAAASGRQRYHQYLEDERRRAEQQERQEKRKRDDTELDNLRAKRKRLESSVKVLIESADSYAEDAEKTGKVELIAQSNSRRRAAKEKGNELKGVEAAIGKFELELRAAGH